jgi:GAF domain-containing protein
MAMTRAEVYSGVCSQLEGLLADVPDFVSAMASAAALLNDTFDHFFWTGFYLPADDGSLTVGPYQGPLACVRLPAGQGVCGACFAKRETIVVPDVQALDSHPFCHISCDARSRSEIVVPVLRGIQVRCILDVDAAEPNAFDAHDRAGLERICTILARVP